MRCTSVWRCFRVCTGAAHFLCIQTLQNNNSHRLHRVKLEKFANDEKESIWSFNSKNPAITVFAGFLCKCHIKFQQISTSALTEQCHEKYELVGKKNNANYIDLARFIAIYAVVLGHFHPFVGMDNIVGRKLIYMFHMPIFFIISGMLSKPTTIKKKHTH